MVGIFVSNANASTAASANAFVAPYIHRGAYGASIFNGLSTELYPQYNLPDEAITNLVIFVLIFTSLFISSIAFNTLETPLIFGGNNIFASPEFELERCECWV